MAYAVYSRGAMGALVPSEAPVAGQPQAPIYPMNIGATGFYKSVRATPAQGACGTKGHPCMHPGVDLGGYRGTKVVAPEAGQIVLVADGNSAPWGGYGPWLVVIRGESGRYHLLAHLDPATAGMGPMGTPVDAGQQVGTTSSANHTHWEVRTKMVPNFAGGEDNFSNNSDPLAWLASAGFGLRQVLLVGGAGLFLYLLWRRSS